MNAADFDKLSDAEKEHFYWCSKCRQFVDKRELRDVIFHETDHRPKPHIPRIKGKPIPKRLSRRYNLAMLKDEIAILLRKLDESSRENTNLKAQLNRFQEKKTEGDQLGRASEPQFGA